MAVSEIALAFSENFDEKLRSVTQKIAVTYLKARRYSCTVYTTETNLTSLVVITPLVLFGLCFGLALPVLLKLYSRCKSEEITPDWLEKFSASAYHPMQGLLSEEDFRFLARQPGFDLSLYRKLRRDRLHIFRQYLNQLIVDFNRLHAVARLLLAGSQEDRSDLLLQLLWLKARFSATVLKTEANYFLCYLGYRSLPARNLILQLEEMSSHVTAIAASHAA